MNSTLKIDTLRWNEAEAPLKSLKPLLAIQEATSPNQTFDNYDAQATHFIVSDTQGSPVGCARLMNTGVIGRPQVLHAFANQGAETLLIESIISYAKENTRLDSLTITEDVRLAPYYVHFGFKADGEPSMDHALPSQRMVYQINREPLPESANDADIIQGADTLKNSQSSDVSNAQNKSFEDVTSYLKAINTVANNTQRILRIYSPTLPAAAFGHPSFIKILSEHCRRSRYTEVRVIILDEKSLVTGTHGLRSLYEKLPSSILIRKYKPTDEELELREFVIPDHGPMTERKRDRRVIGQINHNRSEIAEIMNDFDENWLKSKTIADLRLTTY